MFSQILVGSGTSLVNFLIHATLLAAMVRAIEALSFDDRRAPAYTTLGYGDIVPNKEWRLLGPFTGVLVLGWSTALMLELLRRTGPATAKG
jgi:ion channel